MIQDTFKACVIITQQLVFLCKAIDFLIQVFYIFFMLVFLCVEVAFYRIQPCHHFHELVIHAFFIITTHISAFFSCFL